MLVEGDERKASAGHVSVEALRQECYCAEEKTYDRLRQYTQNGALHIAHMYRRYTCKSRGGSGLYRCKVLNLRQIGQIFCYQLFTLDHCRPTRTQHSQLATHVPYDVMLRQLQVEVEKYLEEQDLPYTVFQLQYFGKP